MNILEAVDIIVKSAIAGAIVSAFGGPHFLFPPFTDARAIFLNFTYYLTGFIVSPIVACINGCAIIALVVHGNIFALVTIGTSCALLRLIAGCEQAGHLFGGDKDA